MYEVTTEVAAAAVYNALLDASIYRPHYPRCPEERALQSGERENCKGCPWHPVDSDIVSPTTRQDPENVNQVDFGFCWLHYTEVKGQIGEF